MTAGGSAAYPRPRRERARAYHPGVVPRNRAYGLLYSARGYVSVVGLRRFHNQGRYDAVEVPWSAYEGVGLTLRFNTSVEVTDARKAPRFQEPAGRLHGFSARVRDISSAVHALSQWPHPSKLEQLEVVAAVRGLCNELR